MMILRTGPASPFGRKARMASAILGLSKDIKVEPADTNDPTDDLRRQNALGKIPVLILDDGSSLFDSRVILEYFDHLKGGGAIIPNEAKARFAALRLQALCDGLCEAMVLQVYENRFRPAEHRVASWVAYQADKVARGLAALEQDPLARDPIPNVGQITLACALGYHDLRFDGAWRKNHPHLVKWHDDFAANVPAFAETKAPS